MTYAEHLRNQLRIHTQSPLKDIYIGCQSGYLKALDDVLEIVDGMLIIPYKVCLDLKKKIEGLR